MASIRKELVTRAKPADVRDAVRDIGALHTRLVPGFVTAMRLEPGARVVTFANGMTVREPIVTIDEQSKRLVWSAIGGSLTHYNASAQVVDEPDGSSRVIWIADLLPDEAAQGVEAMMDAGIAAMKVALDRLAH